MEFYSKYGIHGPSFNSVICSDCLRPPSSPHPLADAPFLPALPSTPAAKELKLEPDDEDYDEDDDVV